MSDDVSLSPSQLDHLAAALAAAGEGVAGPLSAALIAGGRSNLTYRLTDGHTRWVLRSPPRVGRTASAHDVAREFKVTAALGATDVPVARAVLLEQTDDVLGVPFMISDFVDGHALRERDQLAQYDPRALTVIIDSLVTSLTRLHNVDHTAVGLADFARPTHYAARQLRRWSTQWETVGPSHLDTLTEQVVSGLRAKVEAATQARATIVHGDFRVDNTLLGADGRVRAIVDWELSTIGDPVADVAMMCAYRDPAFDLVLGHPTAWASPLLPSPERIAQDYLNSGGAPLTNWTMHLALAHYKIAVIAAGIGHRHRAGASTGATAGDAVEPYLHLAHRTLTGARGETP